MRTRTLLAASVLLGAVVAAPRATAAEWYPGQPGQRQAGDAEPASRAYLAQFHDQLGLGGVDLVLAHALAHSGSSTVRYVQRHAGLPVYGKGLAVRVLSHGRVSMVAAELARELSVSPNPVIDQAGAIAAVAALGFHVPGNGTEAELGVLPNGSGGALVWRVHVPTRAGMVRYVIDAHSGSPMGMANLAMHAKGKVYAINSFSKPVERELSNLTPPEAPDAGQQQTLTGRAGHVTSFVSGSFEDKGDMVLEQWAQPDSQGDFLYDPPDSEPDFKDPFAEVNIYYHLDRMDSYFRSELSVKMDYGLIAIANFGEQSGSSVHPYDNAFFTTWYGKTKNAIVMGQGSSTDLAYDSDVFLHEFTHYVNHNAINFSDGPIAFDEYGLATMPGSINEGSADYFSCSVNNDSIVGEASLGWGARDLEQMSGKCPRDLSGESHQDGTLLGTASWAIRQLLGPQLADRLIWGGMSMLYSGASFGDIAQGVLATAEDFKSQGTLDEAQVTAIKAVFDKRGMTECHRILPLEAGKPLSSELVGMTMIGWIYGGYSCAQLKPMLSSSSLFQFKYTPQPGELGVKLTASLSGGGSKWAIYGRTHEPIYFTGGNWEPFRPDVYDYVAASSSDEAVMVIDANSNPPFDPGASYTFVIGSQNCDSSTLVVEATGLVPVPDAGPESGADSGKDAALEAGKPLKDGGVKDGSPQLDNDLAEIGGGACACRSARSSSAAAPASFLALLGLAMLGIRRRR